MTLHNEVMREFHERLKEFSDTVMLGASNASAEAAKIGADMTGPISNVMRDAATVVNSLDGLLRNVEALDAAYIAKKERRIHEALGEPIPGRKR